ncbi:MAG: putative sugar nucleotidyl transferase, partial [Candidatus Zixiibacteriota bacterium]
MRRLLIIFDGVRADRFAPLNLLRPSYFLRSGIVESWIHLKRCFSGYDLRFEAPAHLELMVKKHTGVSVNDYDYQDYDRIVLINGALIPDPEFVRLVSSCEAGTAFISDGDLGAIVFAGDSKAARQYAKSEHTPSARAEFGSSLGAVSDFR